MSNEVFFSKMVTKGLEPIESDGRFFEGYLTVQVKDKQGEVTIVDELYKVLPIWMDRGAPITDTHSNRVIGKGINFSRSDYTDSDGTIYPAIKVTGKIYKDYELDNEIWSKIKSGEYKGLSFGGSTKTDREPMRMKDGSIAYSLSKLEHYEVAVCRDPAVPLAVITDVNPIAKANMNCDHTGCYVTKPILGAPDFESATRKVMNESDVPKENAKRIVGAAERNAKKCDVCGLPKINKYEETGELGGKESDEDILELLQAPKKKPQGVGDIGTISGKKFTGKLKKPLGKNTFKNIVATNKILGLYQGNAIPLARILDKDATRDTFRTTNSPAKELAQTTQGQSTRARRGSYYDDSFHSNTPSKKLTRGKPPTGGKDDYHFPSEDATQRNADDPSWSNWYATRPRGNKAPKDIKLGKGMFDKILKRGRIAGERTPPSAKKPRWGGGTNQDVKRPKSGKLHRSEAARLDFARHGGENMSVGDLTNYIRNIGEAGGDTSQFDAQLARAKERANSKQRDDKTAALINYIKDAPKDIAQPTQSGNVPKKDSWIAGMGDKDIGIVSRIREPRGQSHGAQSTNARLGTGTGDVSPSEGWYRDSQGGQPDVSGRDESVMNYVNPDTRDRKYVKPSHANPRGDPRRRKSLFSKIYSNIVKKN